VPASNITVYCDKKQKLVDIWSCHGSGTSFNLIVI